MNIIIAYNPSFTLFKIPSHFTVYQLRLLIEKHINYNDITLCYNGKLLDDSKQLSDYYMRNNSIITINERLRGGTLTGFPDIGHLTVLYLIAFLLLTLIILFFYTIVGEIARPTKDCSTGLWLSSTLTYNPILLIVYWMVLCFYASTIVSILTLYSYTYWCSDFQITASPIITSGIISTALAIGIIAYYYVANNEIGFITRFFGKYGDKMKRISLLLFTIILAVVSIGFMIHLALTSINKYILLYPASVVVSGLLFYFFIMRSYPISIKIFIGVIIFLIPFATYTYAYVVNSADRCV